MTITFKNLATLVRAYNLPLTTELIIKSDWRERWIKEVAFVPNPDRILLYPLTSNGWAVCTLDTITSLIPRDSDKIYIATPEGERKQKIDIIKYDEQRDLIIFRIEESAPASPRFQNSISNGGSLTKQ